VLTVSKGPPLIAVAAVAMGAGCGGSSEELPPPPEPARSPPLKGRPAGRVLRVGHKPEGLALDPATGILAVGLRDPDALALVDSRRGRVLRRIRLPAAPRHLQLARPGGPVLVPAERANALVEVSLPSGGTRITRVGRQPHDAAAASGRIFVGDERGNTVSVVQGGRAVRTLEAPAAPGGVAATTDGRYVGVVAVRERVLRVLDVPTLRRVGQASVGVGPTHVVAGLRRFFVVDTRGEALLEVRLRGGLPVVHRRTHLAGSPYGVALDPRRGRFWVTLTGRNRVAELTDRRVVRTFPTVREPNTVAVDARTGRVFVTGRHEGTLQSFDP
jgi:DNA-binding beta-propeller fold protein YncE